MLVISYLVTGLSGGKNENYKEYPVGYILRYIFKVRW
jgi:hypothetical protein